MTQRIANSHDHIRRTLNQREIDGLGCHLDLCGTTANNTLDIHCSYRYRLTLRRTLLCDLWKQQQLLALLKPHK